MGRPRVTLCFAPSLRGRIATRTGSARWISGPPATPEIDDALRFTTDRVERMGDDLVVELSPRRAPEDP